MGEQVHDPNRRSRYAFRREGDKLIVDIWAQPGGDAPLHLHPAIEERFEVLEGKVRFRAGRQRLVAGPGEHVVVRPGTKHSFRNVGEGEARLRAEARPAGDLQGLLEDLAGAARAGLYTRRGVPTSLRGALRVAAIVDRHRGGTVVCSPPGARLMLPLLSRLSGGR